MIVNSLTDFSEPVVYDRGVPNSESIGFLVRRSLNLGQFGIMLGVRVPTTEMAVPMRDNLFWFGDVWVENNDCIFIYTGSGEKRTTKSIDGKSNVYIGHWGRSNTVLAKPEIVPILFKIESVSFPALPSDTPQNKQIKGI